MYTSPYARPPRGRLPWTWSIGIGLCLFLLAPPMTAAPAPAVIPWATHNQSVFVTALCADLRGQVWLATEGEGVWRYEPGSPRPAHFTVGDGLGSDNVYALAWDAKGRLWAGTRLGLSVFNGRRWRTYGPPDGPGGWRVFALATSPATATCGPPPRPG